MSSEGAVNATRCVAFCCANERREEPCRGTSVSPSSTIGSAPAGGPGEEEEEAEEEEEEAVPLAADDDARERSRIGNGWASARSPCVVPWWLTGTCDGSMMFSTSVV